MNNAVFLLIVCAFAILIQHAAQLYAIRKNLRMIWRELRITKAPKVEIQPNVNVQNQNVPLECRK